jgi:C-terminal processing protease CtpA/Prc
LAQYLKADGIIGADILNRYRVIFDYQTSRLILHPSPRTGMPFHYNRDGMLYKRLGETSPAITIASVAAGSAGARAGLRAGDRLVAIDGASTETIEIDSIYERFRHPGEYQLSILRDVEMIDIVLVLADNPPTPHV